MHKIVDVKLALSTMGNLEFILNKVYKEFLINNKNYIQELEAALTNDLDKARRMVHSIKGISVNLGSTIIFESAKDFEITILNQSKEEIKEAFLVYKEDFQNMYNEISTYMKEMNLYEKNT